MCESNVEANTIIPNRNYNSNYIILIVSNI